MTLEEILKDLREREKEASRWSQYYDHKDSLYHEGRSDAYGVAIAMIEKLATKAELIDMDLTEEDPSNYGRG